VGQWRFGDAAHKRFALLKAYVVPVGLHWMYDFPLLAMSAADKLKGPAREAALSQSGPWVVLSISILGAECIWAMRLVNRLRREQIEMTRAVAAAAAAAQGASDVIATINAHPAESPPRAGVSWFMAIAGGLLATLGGF